MKLVGIEKKNVQKFGPLLLPSLYTQIEQGKLYAIGAVENNIAVGIMVFAVKQENIFLVHSIVVAPEFQKKGIGTSLLNWLTIQALDEEAGIICSFEESKNHIVEKLMLKCGFEIKDSISKDYTISADKLSSINTLNCTKYKDQVTTISSESDLNWKRFFNKRILQNDTIIFHCYPSNAPSELSLCIKAGREIVGCLITNRLTENEYEISYVYMESQYTYLIVPLLEVFRENAVKELAPSASLNLTAVTENAVRLSEKILPEDYKKSDRKVAFFNIA